jgi:paraquat-inducible protein A
MADLGLLVAGLALPVVRMSSMGGISGGAYSIIESIMALLKSGQWLLALVILSFSVIFPGIKITLLLMIWLKGFSVEGRFRIMRILHQLSKWSMMDVFVVAVLVGTIRLGLLADAAIEPGIYFFAGAILLSMILIFAMSRLAIGHRIIEYIPRKPGWASSMVALLVIPLFVIGLILPIMEVEKWLFWDRDYSILSACLVMATDGNYGMALLFFFLVVLFPLFKITSVFFLGLVPENWRWQHHLESVVLYLDEWAMSDVFALGLIVAVFKISDVVGVEIRAGLWLFFSALVLSYFSSLFMGRARRYR